MQQDSRARSASNGQQGPKITTRILCIEQDHDIAISIADALLGRGIAVTAVGNAEDAVAAILREAPHLVLFDARAAQASGAELVERLIKVAPRLRSIPFVFLTTRFDRISAFMGRQLGVDDYVTKPIDFDALETTIRSRVRLARADGKPRLSEVTLNHRQVETLTWVARGRTSAQIAKILGLTKRTVDFHLDNARKALGVATRTEAVMKASQGRLIKP
jgi:DNA-binding NarL/FixJ family response regulator